MTKERKAAIDRLAEAITYYWQHEPKDPRARHKFLVATAGRYRVHPKSLQQAIQIESGVYINV